MYIVINSILGTLLFIFLILIFLTIMSQIDNQNSIYWQLSVFIQSIITLFLIFMLINVNYIKSNILNINNNNNDFIQMNYLDKKIEKKS